MAGLPCDSQVASTVTVRNAVHDCSTDCRHPLLYSTNLQNWSNDRLIFIHNVKRPFIANQVFSLICFIFPSLWGNIGPYIPILREVQHTRAHTLKPSPAGVLPDEAEMSLLPSLWCECVQSSRGNPILFNPISGGTQGLAVYSSGPVHSHYPDLRSTASPPLYIYKSTASSLPYSLFPFAFFTTLHTHAFYFLCCILFKLIIIPPCFLNHYFLCFKICNLK